MLSGIGMLVIYGLNVALIKGKFKAQEVKTEIKTAWKENHNGSKTA